MASAEIDPDQSSSRQPGDDLAHEISPASAPCRAQQGYGPLEADARAVSGLSSRQGCAGLLGLLLPSQDGLSQIVELLFDHAVEQRILPIIQPRVAFRPVFPS